MERIEEVLSEEPPPRDMLLEEVDALLDQANREGTLPDLYNANEVGVHILPTDPDSWDIAVQMRELDLLLPVARIAMPLAALAGQRTIHYEI